MAYGNAIGSIICNTALIAAISITVNPGPVNVKSMKTPAIFFFCSAALYCIAAYFLGTFPQWMGFVMLAIFVCYMLLTVRNGLKNPDAAAEEEEEEESSGMPWSGINLIGAVALLVAMSGNFFGETPTWFAAVMAVVTVGFLLFGSKIFKASEVERKLWMELILLVAGAGIIAVGADLLVEHGQVIALGLGVPAPSPEWGALLSAGRTYLRQNSNLTLFPGLAIMITVLAFNMLGDALRDALDPKLKK